MSNRYPSSTFVRSVAASLLIFAVATSAASPSASFTPLAYEVTLQTLSSGYDQKTCWVHPRAGIIPGPIPSVVLTMQKALLSTGDYFYALNEMRTDDLGRTWSGPVEHEALGRHQDSATLIRGVADFTPAWHAKTGRLLGIGIETRYVNGRKPNNGSGRTAYSVYDHVTRTWAPWAVLEMPQDERYFYAAAGCVQRVDLENGEVLLPIHFKPEGANHPYITTVLRCSFDGKTLKYVGRSPDVTRPFEADLDGPPADGKKAPAPNRQWGLFEPSLTHHRGRFYLTLRNERAGYVATSLDGQRFDEPRRWKFDDGEDVGTYNTQSHWVSHQDGLFLVYTRRGANNDHVGRHRAPLFIAQVDTEKLCLVRATERILVPERGAGLGNFGVTNVNEHESWVTTSEWMVGKTPQAHGSDGSVYVARLKWSRPNQVVHAVPVPAAAVQSHGN